MSQVQDPNKINSFSDSSRAEEQPGFSLAGWKNISPFFWVALLWLLLGVGLSLAFSAEPVASAKWVALLWSTCALDLLTLAKTVAGVLELVSQEQVTKQPALATRALLWGLAKIGSLGLLGLVLWFADNAPTMGLLWGIATLLVVPLLGGFWWGQKLQQEKARSEKELNHA